MRLKLVGPKFEHESNVQSLSQGSWPLIWRDPELTRIPVLVLNLAIGQRVINRSPVVTPQVGRSTLYFATEISLLCYY